MTNILYSESYAQSTSAAAPTNDPGMLSFAPLVLIFAIFYFLLIRPQQKKYKEQQAMINDLKVGDVVSTSGGIIGTVSAINTEKNLLELEISKDVVVKVVRSSVSALIADKADKKDENHKDKKHKKTTKNSK
jgi:preprotein translocase subunit YajC